MTPARGSDIGSAADPSVLDHQASHARYRAVEVRASRAAADARADAERVAEWLAAHGAETVDGDLPEATHEAVTELERRADDLRVRAGQQRQTEARP
jgi:antirestriction protein ArdC